MEYTLSNDKIIAFHRNLKDYEEVKENTLQLAYGDGKYKKMVKQLTESSDILRKKILKEICLDFHRADFITQAILTSDIIFVMIKLFNHKDDEIRILATEAMQQICLTKSGRNIIHEKCFKVYIRLMIFDINDQIRINTYNALLNYCEFTDGTNDILINPQVQDKETTLIDDLVQKLIDEKDDNILILVLKLSKRLLYGEIATSQILQTDAIKIFLDFLSNQNKIIKQLAVDCLSCISFNEEGKADIIAKGGVLQLCNSLSDECEEVRIVVTMCLASLAQLKQGKYEMVDNHYFSEIAKMLDENSLEIRLNIVQLISSLSEYYPGRHQAKLILYKLEEMIKALENKSIVTYIQQTIDVINWVP